MKHIIQILALILLAASQSLTALGQDNSIDTSPSTTELLDQLDGLLKEYPRYTARYKAKSDSVRQLMIGETDRRRLAELNVELGHIDGRVMTDSSVVAYTRAINLYNEIGDSVQAQRTILIRARQYINSGDAPRGFYDLGVQEHKSIYPENRQLYHQLSARLYITMGAFFDLTADNHNMRRGEAYARRWAMETPAGSAEHDLATALIYMAQGKYQLMASVLHDALDKLSPDDYFYPIVTVILGEYYWSAKNYDAAISHYANSAMANIRHSRIEEVALLRLGELLYHRGDTKRANEYLGRSLEIAIQGDEKFNLMRINNAYTEVSKALDNQKYRWLCLSGAFVLVALVFVIVLLRMMASKRAQVEKLKATEKRLARTNMAKETYITEFLNLSSQYIEQIEEYNKLCQRRLAAGHYDELMNMVKSGRAVDKARQKFNEVFDHALLQLFPDFIADVNRLLLPDRQIATPGHGKLNTELRIAALTRLGIEDPNVIAQSLGISNNTVYTYRNKLRTRAIDRSNIDEQIRSIGLTEADKIVG